MFGIKWLAGWLEGEGSFMKRRSTNGQGRSYLYPCIQAVSVDRDAVRRAANLLGIRKIQGPYQREGRQPYWLLAVQGRRAETYMHMLYPLMCERRQRQIEEALNASCGF